jgi:hypothetical protein
MRIRDMGCHNVAASAAINSVSIASADGIDTPAEKSSTLAASPADADNNPEARLNDSSDGLASGSKVEEGSDGGDEAGTP